MSGCELPLVSVVVTTYNQAAYVAETLRSALAQTYPNTEVIVVDDGSTDDTAVRVAAFGGAVRYVCQANAGVAASRNTGIGLAAGELLAFLDGDDLWEPEKLATQVAVARAHPDAGLIVVDGVQFSADTVTQDALVGPPVGPRLRAVPGQTLLLRCYGELLRGNFISTTSQVMVPADVFTAVGVSDTRFPVCSDYDLYLRIAARHPVAFVARPLTRWRYLPGSASGPAEVRHLRWAEDVIEVLKKRRREAARGEGGVIDRLIRARLFAAAQEAYYSGLAGRRGSAARYLAKLALRNPGAPAVLSFLVALWSPRFVVDTLGPALRKWLGRAARAK